MVCPRPTDSVGRGRGLVDVVANLTRDAVDDVGAAMDGVADGVVDVVVDVVALDVGLGVAPSIALPSAPGDSYVAPDGFLRDDTFPYVVNLRLDSMVAGL